jgi:hypothetical protein
LPQQTIFSLYSHFPLLERKSKIMRNREAEVQDKISAIRERLETGLKQLPKHDHLKGLPIEYEPLDYQTLVVHFSNATFFSDADIATIKELVGGSRSCELTHDSRNRMRLSFTISL